jgi:hypothetical protein
MHLLYVAYATQSWSRRFTVPRRNSQIAGLFMELWAKAVLKPPHSTRWRDHRRPTDCAKRLECGVFTAALEQLTVRASSRVQGAKFLGETQSAILILNRDESG